MVHIGCGADVIRQRRRNEQLRKENEAKGIFTIPPDFKPAKNKKYPHYTPLRNANIFSQDRQLLSFERKKKILSRQSSDVTQSTTSRKLPPHSEIFSPSADSSQSKKDRGHEAVLVWGHSGKLCHNFQVTNSPVLSEWVIKNHR